MAIVSLADVKLQLGKTSTADDTELQAYIDATTDVIEEYCGAIVPQQVSEWHDDIGASEIQLREERVISITSVTGYLGTSTYNYVEAATPDVASLYSYEVDPSHAGRLVRLGSGGYPQPFVGRTLVVYQAGFSTIPASINLAARLIVQSMWRSQNGGAGLPALSDEPTLAQPADEPMPARAAMLLRRYQRTPAAS
ncbi:MAG: phage head-tail connector protein [Blastococcus sp.]